VENKANYALIGMFVLVALTAILGFAIWLSGFQFNKKYDIYEIAFEGGVRGLSQGSEVRFNGLGVGEVTSLAYDRDDINLVLAQIQVTEGAPIDVDSTAKLTPLGLTGLNYIEITPGTDAEAPLMIELPGFANILKNIETITASVDVSELDATKLNDLMDSITAAANAFESTAKAYEGTSEHVNAILQEDLRRAIAKIENTLVGVDGVLGTADTTFTEFGTTALAVDGLVADAQVAVQRLSNSGLSDVEDTLSAVQELVTTLGRVADSLEQHPTQFIVGTEREKMELPQ